MFNSVSLNDNEQVKDGKAWKRNVNVPWRSDSASRRRHFAAGRSDFASRRRHFAAGRSDFAAIFCDFEAIRGCKAAIPRFQHELRTNGHVIHIDAKSIKEQQSTGNDSQKGEKNG